MDQRAHSSSATADGTSGEQAIRVKAAAVACLRVAPKSSPPSHNLPANPAFLPPL